jgi:O-antigen ligase/tetratricopeptide (TPR) repeat protein
MAVDSRMESSLGLIARLLAVGAIVFATINFGAVDVTIQLVACLLILAALILAMLRPKTRPLDASPWMSVCLAAWLGWLLLLGIQIIPLPESIVSVVSPTATAIRQSFGPEVSAGSNTIALLPGKASAAWATQVIGFGFFLVGAVCWRTREQRNYLFAAIVLGGVLFAGWGLLNRFRGTMFLLPGVEAPDRSHPFSTLIYKNAGASLLVLSMATAIGVLLETLRPALRQKIKQLKQSHAGGSNSDGGYSQQGQWAEPQVFLMLFVIVLFGVAIAFTLSRGLWVVALLSLSAWLISLRRLLSTKALIGGAALLVGGLAGSLIWLGLGSGQASSVDVVLDRAATLEVDLLSQNGRFSHWSDSLETVMDFPVLGSGLGSYGYVQLLHQDVDTPRWFEHAHNMLLEWAVETGIVGVLLVCLGVFAYAMLLRRLYTQRLESTVFVTSFSVGLIAGLSLLIQSCFDFTVLTPIVAWAHALVLGAVASTSNERSRGKIIETVRRQATPAQKADQAKDLPMTPAISLGTRLSRIGGRPFIWSLAASGLLLLAQAFLQREIIDQRLLVATRLSTFNLAPSQQSIDSARERLSSRIGAGSTNSRLYQRLAQWELAAFRRQLMEQAKKNGQALTWLNTTPDVLFRVYHQLPPEARATVLRDWTSGDGARKQIAACVENLDASLACNPLVPQVHLQLASLSPLTDRDIRRPIQNAKILSASDGGLQFQLGLIGYCLQDDKLMIDQWQRSLAFAPENASMVLELAQERLSPADIATKVLARIRPDTWVSLTTKSQTDPKLEDFRQVFHDQALASLHESELPAHQRHYLTSRVHESTGDFAAAAQELGKAVHQNGRNLEYRRRLAVSLWRSGALPQAREQLILATALEPSNPDLLELLTKVETQMKRALK